MTIEGLRLRINKFVRKLFAKKRKKDLLKTNFTIISNNCWGGMIYESYAIQKQSPTVGLFFMAKDYIKFVSNLKEYLFSELLFIEPKESKWASYFENDKSFGTYPIGRLKDIEIFFAHYKNEKEAKEKWSRRIKRINWDNLILKFNDQNGCTYEDILCFDKLPFKKKICFSVKPFPELRSVVQIKAPKKHLFIRTSYEPFGKSRRFNVTAFINKF